MFRSPLINVQNLKSFRPTGDIPWIILCLWGFLQYCSNVSWRSKLETWDSILASRTSNASSFEMLGSSLECRWSRIQEARFSERTMLYSHVPVQIFTSSISACGAVFCNWIVGVRQAFNKCKSIFSFSKCRVMDAGHRGNRITVC